MNNCAENDYPRLCDEVGLSCHTCTEGTARELAQACKGLQSKSIAQLFVQIHSHTACAKMHAHFATSYRAASVERKPVMSEKRGAMSAVA